MLYQLRFILLAVILSSFQYLGKAQTNVYKLKTVVIDAGHGGKDPGAVGKNGYEKNITLAIALKTGKYIQEKIPDVKVIYTRNTDKFVELYERAGIANRNKADLFISIHVNASTNPDAYGTDTWIMGLHKSKANLEVAKRENKVIMVEDNYSTKYQGLSADSTEAIIIYTMMQSANLEQSALLGSIVQSEFRDKVNRKDRGVHSAPFMVLWKTSMPSILIETGFLSNPEEEKFLLSEEGQDLMASAIYRAFKDYKNKVETKTNIGISTSQLEELEKVQEPKTENKQKNQNNIEQKDSIKTTISKPVESVKSNETTNTTETSKPIEKEISNSPISKDSITNKTVEKTDLIDKFANQLQTDSVQTNKSEIKTKLPVETKKEQPILNSTIIYSFQLASSKTKVEPIPENFKGIQYIKVIQEDGWYKYSVGNFTTYKEIMLNYNKIKQLYPEAFIVARKNGVKIPVQEAKLITQ